MPKSVFFSSASSTSLTLIYQSKLANVLFAKELARRLSGERIFSNSINPGFVNSEISRGSVKSYPCARPIINCINGFFATTTYQGATTPLYAATATEIEENNWRYVALFWIASDSSQLMIWMYRGEYFDPIAKHSKPSQLAQNSQLARDLWDFSERIIEEKTGYKSVNL